MQQAERGQETSRARESAEEQKPSQPKASPQPSAQGLQVGGRAQLRPGVKALNIRSGPGVRYRPVGYALPRDVLVLQSGPKMVGSSPWYAILNETRRVKGWVNGRYLTPRPGS
ncbi:MAG TPA: SH3 domain-containing protein [Caldilineae bacterium]|jgi:hypothetical protein|nr:SH3 domain-containing protein [Caldilineae bacterium]